MANEQGQPKANDKSDWSSKEMNPAANSSVAEDNLSENDTKNRENTQRDSEIHIQRSETESETVNPGRTPGKAEGVEDPEETGNQ